MNRVWHTFKSENPLSGEIDEFVVQDLPEESFEEAIKFMLDHFLPDEPICKAKNIVADEDALQQICGFWRDDLQQRVSLGCFKKGRNELIGLNILCVITKRDVLDFNLQKSNSWKAVHDFALTRHNLFDHYTFADKILIAYGLSVSKNYRQRGIATEILRARIPLCTMLSIPLTSTVFTAIGSQKPAEKIGFQVDYEISYDDLKQQFQEFAFDDLAPNSLKLMSLVIKMPG